jgi:flavin-binding protein dodecin
MLAREARAKGGTQMTAHERFAAISFESFQAAADEALKLMPGGLEGLKRARVVDLRIQTSDLTQTEYTVILEDLGAEV